MLATERTVARPTTAGVLLVQGRVDRPAVAAQAVDAKPTLRNQGVLERTAGATVGVSLAVPIGTVPSGPR